MTATNQDPNTGQGEQDSVQDPVEPIQDQFLNLLLDHAQVLEEQGSDSAETRRFVAEQSFSFASKLQYVFLTEQGEAIRRFVAQQQQHAIEVAQEQQQAQQEKQQQEQQKQPQGDEPSGGQYL